MECTARWLENASDPMQAAAEIRLAMAELRNCIADCESVGDAGEKELSACPFCGGAEFAVASEQVERDSYAARIDCDVCEASFSTQYTESSEALAIHKVKAAWNRRAAVTAEKVAAEPVANATVKVYETYTGQNGWLEVTQEEYDRTKDKYEHRIRRVSAPQQPAQSAERKYDPRDPGNWRDGDDATGNAAQSAEQDEPYGYAPANPNGNYFTRNKSTADYVGGMIPVYARAASAQSTAPQPALTDKRAHEMYEAAMSEMMRGGPYQSIEASTAAVVRALLRSPDAQ
jgi:Lar family restriction alleviation protein